MSAARWVIANDHAGLALKPALTQVLTVLGLPVDDLGTTSSESVDYADFAHRACESIVSGRYEHGILVCGTGVGISIAANRHRGIRAALCNDLYTARMARLHNDANVLCLGARVVGAGLAEEILRAFVQTPFEAGRHRTRIAKIDGATG